MSEIGSLSVRINAKTAQLEKSLNNVQKRLQDTGKKVGAMGKGLTKFVTGPIVGATAGIAGLVMKTTEYGDELDKTSSKLGVSVERLQDWNHWAEQNGISTNAMERGLGRLNQRVGRAVDGNEKYSDAFADLNVELKDGEGNIRATNDVMEDTVSALMEVEDPAMRSAQASEIFGTKMARDLMPALEDGSLSIEEATAQMDEHGRITGEQAEQSAKFQDTVDNLKKSFMGIVQEIGMDFLPLIQDKLLPLIEDKVIPAIRGFAERIQGLIGWFTNLNPQTKKIILTVIGLVAALGPVLIVVGKIIGVISALAPLFGALKGVILALTGPIGLVVLAIAGLIAIGWLLYENWEEVTEWLKGIWEKFAEFFVELWDKMKEWFFGKLEEFHDIVKEIWGAIDEYILDTVRSIYNNVSSWFGDIISWATDAWYGFWDSVEMIWEGITDSIKGAVNSIIGLVNGMIAGIEGGINFVIGGVNDFIDNINSRIRGLNRVPGVNISTIGTLSDISLGSIPTLHDGGTFRAPNPGGEGLAMLEDRERVIPAGMSGGESVNIFVELDGRTIARAIGEPFVKEIRAKTGLRI